MIHRDKYWSMAQDAKRFLKEQNMYPAGITVQCGSGLSGITAEILDGPKRIPLKAIPHMPVTAVSGHGKEALYGVVDGTGVLALTGRIHVYEGHSPLEAGFPAAVAKAAGCLMFLATNAAGALNGTYRVGDVMLHQDFINMQGDNAAAHLGTEHPRERFIDPKPAYDETARGLLKDHLTREGITCHEGVYLAVRGPMYETAAELRMMQRLGGDAIGMSTVPEVTVSHLAGLPAVGLSVITNECFTDEVTQHEDVVRHSGEVAPKLGRAIRSFIAEWISRRPSGDAD